MMPEDVQNIKKPHGQAVFLYFDNFQPAHPLIQLLDGEG